ncbi:unnamed protein product [Durusdinium trenchii]|uniref:Uncharacterized protein n=1 Tax=Durusdinium trenchii TaxID=1381693 RepID=A0ABP0QSX2_9DINO
MKHLGVKDPELEKIARAGPTSKRKQFRNICRNFHANLLRDGRQLKVTVSMIKVRVKVHRPKVRTIEAEYPYISLRSWSTFLLQHHPAHLLGGFDFEDFDGYTSMFDRFWTRYRQLDPTHEAFTQFTDSGHVIPYMVHGDEGRGKNKSPILICNYQPCIGVQGEEFTNMKGHSFSTRFLSFMMPSKHFAEDDKTLDDYTAYIVADLSSLFYDGNWWHVGSNGCLHGWQPGRASPPWKAKRSLFMKVPGASSEARIRTDLAHTWPIGVAKSSQPVLVVNLRFEAMSGRALDAQLENLYADFRERRQYPVLSGMGHDCIIVQKWLSDFLSRTNVEDVVPWLSCFVHAAVHVFFPVKSMRELGCGRPQHVRDLALHLRLLQCILQEAV